MPRRLAVFFAALVALLLVAAGCGGSGGAESGTYAVADPPGDGEGAEGDSDGTEQSAFEGLVVDPPRKLPDAVLTDTSGEPFDLRADTAGQVRLLYFGFTNCVDICSIDMAQLDQVLSRPGVPPNIDVLFVTVDPARDTEEVLRAYLDKFDPNFIGLRARDDAQLNQLQLEVGALAHIRLDDTAGGDTASDAHADDGHSHGDDDGHGSGEGGDHAPLVEGDRNYQIGHDGRVFAYAPDGFSYTQYPHGSRQSHFVHDLPMLARLTGA